MQTQMNRKTATKLKLVQWSRFQDVTIRLEGSSLFTGVNGSGKSTILDAVTYLLTGNTQFNKAAKDRDRTVKGYVRGDTRSTGATRYLRNGEVVSYVAMEFYSPVEQDYLVVGVCMESANEADCKSSWFVCRGAQLEQMNFTRAEKGILHITPRNQLSVNGSVLKTSDFWGRDRGVEQVLRALGLRCDVTKYRNKLLKMLAFNPENNIDQFIQDCVLEPGKVDSLQELREQKRQFEHIRQMYDNLKDSKVQLETVEQKTLEYEAKQRNLLIRELMLIYQQLREREEENKSLEAQMEILKHRRSSLNLRKEELQQRQKAAFERYRIAESNDVFRGMKDTIGALERQAENLTEEIKNSEEQLAEVKKLQLKLRDICIWAEEYFDVTEEEKRTLSSLAEKGITEEQKAHTFLKFSRMVDGQEKLFEREGVHKEDTIATLETEMDQLEEKIKLLQANQVVFPEKVERAKQILLAELRKQGARSEVKFFAELVQEIKNPQWRAAIETFLGKKRYHIIVDGKDCHMAMRILEQKSIHDVQVVITDKLPDVQIVPGSAAEVLTIPNVFARRYANYLLNGIHLCESLEELHEYPKGGLMKNGMLAKSYAVSYMNVKKTEFCMGEDAVRHQLKKALETKQEKLVALQQEKKSLEVLQLRRGQIRACDWQVEHYRFDAVNLLESLQREKKNKQKELDKIRENPDFIAVLKEQQDAKQEYENLQSAVGIVDQDIGTCKNGLETCKDRQKQVAGEIYELDQEYSRQCVLHLELKRPMLEEYERLIKGKANSWQAITQKTVINLRGELQECIKQLETAQWNYCKLAEIDINKRGVGYIPFYREEYRNIANIKIEEAHNRLKEQGERLESAFMNDFVAEINETVREAKKEIDAINRELRQIPFGNDTYKFIMKEKPDRSVFFRICRRLESYMDSPEVYMNSNRDDEEMERDIQEFMSVILEEEDEQEYTDYRKYFIYDMEIVSRQGKEEITSELSAKQGSASNGEKQTPYFIILAASLMQYYPRQVCCARLAFIDEAFSALSRERIEQMVKYFEENNFQVIYAAPPEKINSIGSFIGSTVSLVITGRYTNVVEGLVKKNDIYTS